MLIFCSLRSAMTHIISYFAVFSFRFQSISWDDTVFDTVRWKWARRLFQECIWLWRVPEEIVMLSKAFALLWVAYTSFFLPFVTPLNLMIERLIANRKSVKLLNSILLSAEKENYGILGFLLLPLMSFAWRAVLKEKRWTPFCVH